MTYALLITRTMESLILDIRALKSGILSLITLSFCHINDLRKRSNQTLQAINGTIY